jgi:Tfp pilus assembly protein PilN
VIKVNLIQGPVQERNVKVRWAASTKQKNGIYVLAGVLLSFGIVGLFYMRWSDEASGLEIKIAEAQVEAAHLSQIEAENGKYAAELSEIQSHIMVIQSLEKTRIGPQDLMTRLGSAVGGVSGVYLTSVKSDGAQLAIEGESDHLNAIANFISSIQNDHSFQQVALNQVYEDDQQSQVIFKFGLVCLYTPPVETAALMPPAAPAGRSGRPPGRN